MSDRRPGAGAIRRLGPHAALLELIEADVEARAAALAPYAPAAAQADVRSPEIARDEALPATLSDGATSRRDVASEFLVSA